jgi:hypothetical protein
MKAEAEIKFGQQQDPWSFGGINPFTGGLSELGIQETSHVNRNFMPITVFLVLLKEIIHLLMAD